LDALGRIQDLFELRLDGVQLIENGHGAHTVG
jgi:hypothetical protein